MTRSYHRGYFITFEGGEGAGKTSVIQALHEYYIAKNLKTAISREPGGIVIAEKIREIILDPAHKQMSGRTEALLYAAARCQHLEEKITPLLNRGYHVFCDRFIDSSLAYQGWARELGIEKVMQINQFALGDIMPDLTFYFDLEPEVGLARIKANEGREMNRLDQESLLFHRLVREGYGKLMEQYDERIVKIDASKPLDEVIAQCILILEQRFPWQNE